MIWVMPAVDYQALGFALTTSDVADMLEKTEAEVHDLTRAGVLPYLAQADTVMGTQRMWFHPDEVARVEVQLRSSVAANSLATDHRNRLRVQAALRAYLAAVPAETRYDEAMLRNAPLVGRTRQRARMIHVRPEAVAAFGTTLDNVPVTISMTTAALEYVGAIRVRGVTALGEPGKQRWGIWFRLPPGFAPGETTEADVIEGTMSGAREEGERVRRRGMGPAVLADPLVPADDFVD